MEIILGMISHYIFILIFTYLIAVGLMGIPFSWWYPTLIWGIHTAYIWIKKY